MATTHAQSSWLIEGNGNPHGNFEMVRGTGNGAEHFWRDNGDPDHPWHGPNYADRPFTFAPVLRGAARWDSPTILLSTFGNLEFVGVLNGGTGGVDGRYPGQDQSAMHYYRDALGWHGPHLAFRHADKSREFAPMGLAHIQRRLGDPPTFELLVTDLTARGGLVHLSRREDPNGWREVDRLGGSTAFEGLGMIDSSYGNLEVVATAGGQLWFMWQGQHGWSDVYPIGVGSGRPVLIQSAFGRVGNFEVLVPAPDGDGLLHYWRDNDNPSMPWTAPTPVPGSTGRGGYDDVALIQSSFDGHFEVLARRKGRRGLGVHPIVDSYWRDGAPGFDWHGPHAAL